jgi:predicted metal-dependent hydrolase
MSLFDGTGSVSPSMASSGAAPVLPVAGSSGPSQAPSVVHFAHARAGHQIFLDGCRVSYLLKRAQRKSIGFVVGPDGLAVTAPRWLGQTEVDAALRAKSGWILRKLQEQQDRKQRVEAHRIEWRDGGILPYLGQSLVLVLDAQASGVRCLPQEPGAPGAAAGQLRIGLPASTQAEQIRDAVQAWLQRQARQHFEGRCAHFAPLLKVQVKRLRLSSAQTRWGSASADGSIRLNWRLVHFSPAVIDYVVVHELAHLREMNHSPAFWAVVQSVIPDMEARKALLRTPAVPLLD